MQHFLTVKLRFLFHQPDVRKNMAVYYGFKNVLAGQEYTQILSVLAHHISILRIIGNLQKEHLDATKGYRETAAADRNQGLIDAIEKAKMV